MRQFWLAVHRSEDLESGHAKPIRIMSEDYTLYRGESGRAQVFDYRCPHRGAQLHLGWVEGDAIRCLYHGWKFDCSGPVRRDAGRGRELRAQGAGAELPDARAHGTRIRVLRRRRAARMAAVSRARRSTA